VLKVFKFTFCVRIVLVVGWKMGVDCVVMGVDCGVMVGQGQLLFSKLMDP